MNQTPIIVLFGIIGLGIGILIGPTIQGNTSQTSTIQDLQKQINTLQQNQKDQIAKENTNYILKTEWLSDINKSYYEASYYATMCQNAYYCEHNPCTYNDGSIQQYQSWCMQWTPAYTEFDTTINKLSRQ